MSSRDRLHQTSASTVRQLCHDASGTALLENNVVTPKVVETPILSNLIVFNELTLGVNEPSCCFPTVLLSETLVAIICVHVLSLCLCTSIRNYLKGFTIQFDCAIISHDAPTVKGIMTCMCTFLQFLESTTSITRNRSLFKLDQAIYFTVNIYCNNIEKY